MENLDPKEIEKIRKEAIASCKRTIFWMIVIAIGATIFTYVTTKSVEKTLGFFTLAIGGLFVLSSLMIREAIEKLIKEAKEKLSKNEEVRRNIDLNQPLDSFNREILKRQRLIQELEKTQGKIECLLSEKRRLKKEIENLSISNWENAYNLAGSIYLIRGIAKTALLFIFLPPALIGIYNLLIGKVIDASNILTILQYLYDPGHHSLSGLAVLISCLGFLLEFAAIVTLLLPVRWQLTEFKELTGQKLTRETFKILEQRIEYIRQKETKGI